MSTKLAAPTVLKTIFDHKTEEVAERQKRCPISELELAVQALTRYADFGKHWQIGWLGTRRR